MSFVSCYRLLIIVKVTCEHVGVYLGQRDCRGFLTHGGLNSLQEAIYHGVPVIGFPFGSDQTINIGRAVKEGYALQMNWNQITEETLDGTLYQLLYDPKSVPDLI